MQPVLSLNPHLGTFNFSPGTIIPPQILIPNSWLVRGRINRRSLRVSHRVPLSNMRRLSLAGRSTFLIACHSAFKLLRRRSACSPRETEREVEFSISRSIAHALHAGNLCTRNDKRTPSRRKLSRRRAHRWRAEGEGKLGHRWCEAFNMLRQ